MSIRSILPLCLLASLGAGCQADSHAGSRPGVLGLWEEEVPAFGIYAPEDGLEDVVGNLLYDFLFLDLERAYDLGRVESAVAAVDAAPGATVPTLLVRIPSLEAAGEDATRARIRDVLDMGADGIVVPHVRTPDEARLLVGFFGDAGADVWTPDNREGRTIAAFLIEDPDAVARAAEFAQIPGYSVLACGIGSLTAALGGDREAGEAGARHVLEEATRAGLPDLITASQANIESRVADGYLAILTSGPGADEVIAAGRRAAGR